MMTAEMMLLMPQDGAEAESAANAKVRAKLATTFAKEPFVAISIARTTGAAYNLTTRRTGTGTPVTITGRGLLSKIVITGENGTRTRASKVMMNVEPMISDVISIGDQNLTVTATEPYSPDGGAPLYFYAMVRG